MSARLPRIQRRFGDAMYVIAGLPPAIAIRTENSLKNLQKKDLERAIYHVPPFSEGDYDKLRRKLFSVIVDNITRHQKLLRYTI